MTGFNMGFGWGNGLMWLTPLLLIALIFWAFSDIGKAGKQKRRSAREQLDLRFANGEIDEDEYQARRKALDN